MDSLSTSNTVRGFLACDTWLQDRLSAVDAWPERAEWRVLVSQMHQVMASPTHTHSLFASYHGETSAPNLDPTSPLQRCASEHSIPASLLPTHLSFSSHRLLHDLSVYLHTDGKRDSNPARRSALLDFRYRLELLAPLVRGHTSFQTPIHLQIN